MTKRTDAFGGFDAFKPFFDFDPSKFVSDWTRTAAQYQIPGMAMTALMDTQRKNLEAAAAANRAVFQGAQALIQRHGEIYEEALEELAESLREIATAETPRAATTKQIERMEQTVSKAQTNLAELSAMATKASNETLEIINKRLRQAFDEAEGALGKLKS